MTSLSVKKDSTNLMMTFTAEFDSLEQMEQILAMGAEEGMIQALGQIDDILASPDVS